MTDVLENAVLLRAGDVPCAELDRELVFLSIEDGKYYALKGTGRRIWDLLSAPITCRELIERLSAEYGIDCERCAAETAPFLQRMIETGLVKAHTAGHASAHLLEKT